MCLHASAPRPTTCTQPSNTHLVMAQPQITSILVWQTNGTPSPEHMGGESKREGATEGKYEDETEHARVCINDPRVKRRLWISWEFCADLVLMWSSRKRLIRLYRRFSNSPHDFIPGFESVYFGIIRINSQKKGECVCACLAGWLLELWQKTSKKCLPPRHLVTCSDSSTHKYDCPHQVDWEREMRVNNSKYLSVWCLNTHLPDVWAESRGIHSSLVVF